jgi:hypothetical protein
MTAREKAIELVDKFQKQIFFEITDERLDIEEAKGCALIAVDEILKQHKKITVSHIVNVTNVQNELDSYVLQNYGYWQEVKQEIKKL